MLIDIVKSRMERSSSDIAEAILDRSESGCPVSADRTVFVASPFEKVSRFMHVAEAAVTACCA
jgi:hypothetical protein